MRLRFLLTIMCLVIAMIPVAIISGLQGLEIASIFLVLILFITLVFSFVISYFITMPLEKLTKNINEISKGNLDVELEKSEIYEINNLTDSLDRVMTSLKLAINKVGVRKDEIFIEVIKAKEEAEANYDILLKKIDGWIWEINENGICTKCSTRITETLGYPNTQMIGKKIFQFLPPKDACKFKEILHVLSQQKIDSSHKFDLYWMTQDNTRQVWVRSFCIPIFDSHGEFKGLRCFSRDSTEYQVANRKIEELQKKLSDAYKQLHEILRKSSKPLSINETLFDSTLEKEYDYMLLFDEQTRIVDCTIGIQQILGYSKQEMLALSFADIVYLDSSRDIQVSLEEIKKEGNIQTKDIHKKKDGTSVFVSEHIRYLKDRNLFICMVKKDKMS